jgi:hypothetical protein
MKAIVIKAYRRPYANPIAVAAGTLVEPDFDKFSEVPGWVWCSAPDGRSGWVPRAWLRERDGHWQITRDYNAIELTVAEGDELDVEFEESGFFWVSARDGSRGWVPQDHVALHVEKS